MEVVCVCFVSWRRFSGGFEFGCYVIVGYIGAVGDEKKALHCANELIAVVARGKHSLYVYIYMKHKLAAFLFTRSHI